MTKTLKLLFLGTLGIILTAVLWLISCTESIVNRVAFQPTKGSVVALQSLPPSINHFYIATSDGEDISSFYFRNPTADKTILYFHGNAGNASQRLPWAKDLMHLNSNVLLVDYRGYGLSSGGPSEKGIYLDARAALKFLEDEFEVELSQTFVYGRSIGSAAAIDLVQDNDVAGLILVTPISSGEELALMSGMESLTSITGNPFNNIEKIQNYEGPVLIIHGDQDEVLPVEMGRRLRDLRKSRVRYVEIPYAGHNNIIRANRQKFYDSIQAFCTDVLAGDL